VNERLTQRICNVLLRQGKGETVVVNEAEQLGALVEAQTISAATRSTALRPPDAGEVFVDNAFFAGAEPSDVEGETRHVAEQAAQTSRRGSTQSCTSVSASMPCCAASNMAACRPSKSRAAGNLESAFGRRQVLKRNAQPE